MAREGPKRLSILQSLIPEDADYDSPAEDWQPVEKKQGKNTQHPVS